MNNNIINETNLDSSAIAYNFLRAISALSYGDDDDFIKDCLPIC